MMMIGQGVSSGVTWPAVILIKISISLVKRTSVNKKWRISGHPVFTFSLYLLYFDFEQAQDHGKDQVWPTTKPKNKIMSKYQPFSYSLNKLKIHLMPFLDFSRLLLLDHWVTWYQGTPLSPPSHHHITNRSSFRLGLKQ